MNPVIRYHAQNLNKPAGTLNIGSVMSASWGSLLANSKTNDFGIHHETLHLFDSSL